MMKIELNGAPHVLTEPTTIAALLDANGYADRIVAVEINREIVPKSMRAKRILNDGDRIEVVHAIGGG
jgi:sulfur carrier protein